MNFMILSNMFVPYIIQPTRITSHSKSIIDNIFSNYISQEVISGNLTSTISDHITSISYCTLRFFKCSKQKIKNFDRDWSKFSREEFILDYTNTSFQNFFDPMGKILDKHAPLKKLSKYKLKFKTKPWITTALHKSISIKDKLFRDFINKKYLS